MLQTLLFTIIENKLFKISTQITLIFLIFIGCSVKEKKSSNEKKSFTAIIEIPAGTNKSTITEKSLLKLKLSMVKKGL